LGRDPKRSGDPVYHGALDNASGVAGLLELARAYTKLPTPPKRTVVFLSVTAEEKGLLGSKYYAQHPLYPIERTLADFNMDGLNPWGRTKDLQVIGQGNSTLEDLLATAAAAQHRTIQPESQPEKGFFYRSDHFEFAKAGVPCLYFRAGMNYLDRPIGFGQKKIDEYISNDYHKVTDCVKPGWDFAGAVEDLRLLFQVGWTVAEEEQWPDWKVESEFHARRQPSQQTRPNP
jgi:Zn-dependent M28 family amino/carboxypeptidase